MNRAVLLTAAAAFVFATAFADAAPTGDAKDAKTAASGPDYFNTPDSTTQSSVTVEGHSVDYQAVAGTIIVHPKDWDDAAEKPDSDSGDKSGDKSKAKGDDANPTAKAAMFYVAYFKQGEAGRRGPITFLFNGGPGSSTVWLHMGAFGPKRVVT